MSPSERPPLSTRRKLAFAAVTFVAIWAVVEIAFQIAWVGLVPDRFESQSDVPVRFGMTNWPDIVEKDPWLFWQLKANASSPRDQGKMSGFVANADHMRNPDLPVERGPRDYRILSLGDSVTFGWGVQYEEAYPTVLGELLAAAHPEREVHFMNGACSGYTTHQGREVLRRRALKYRPDVVTLWFGWNDSVFWDGMTDREHARIFARDHWLSFSATYRMLTYRMRKSEHRELRKQRKVEEDPQPRMPIADFEGALREMVAMIRETEVVPGRGASVVLVQGVYNKQHARALGRGRPIEWDAHQLAVAAVAEELGVPLLRVHDVLREAGHGSEVFLDHGHLDPVGLRAVAEGLVALLEAEGLAPGPVLASQ